MLTDSEDIGGKNRLQLGQVLSSLDEREMSDITVEVQKVKSEHIDKNLDLVDFRGLSGSRGQDLKRQQLFGGLIDCYYFTINDEAG